MRSAVEQAAQGADADPVDIQVGDPAASGRVDDSACTRTIDPQAARRDCPMRSLSDKAPTPRVGPTSSRVAPRRGASADVVVPSTLRRREHGQRDVQGTAGAATQSRQPSSAGSGKPSLSFSARSAVRNPSSTTGW